jgi:hypothetical protein
MSDRRNRGIRARVGSQMLALAALSALVLAQPWPSRAQSQSTASKSASASAPTSASVATVNTVPGSHEATPKSVAATTAPTTVAETAKPGNDGIKIHGHWVLEVKNPDGKLVDRREFENSLVTYAAGAFPTGDQILAALLSGNATAGDPAIVFISNASAGGPADSCPGAVGASCNYFYTNSASVFSSSSTNGQTGGASFEPGLSIATNFSPAVSWVLSGNYTVPNNVFTSIGAVETTIPMCYSQTGPFGTTQGSTATTWTGTFPDRSADIGSKSCDRNDMPNTDSFSFANLTYTLVPGGPLAVVSGQIITVTVTISFS